ncbi:MAG: glycosyltransferase, partial [Methanobacteriaceae archaeon]|nr:glycosyltransferase [Methanobacteriaceae archaeon]
MNDKIKVSVYIVGFTIMFPLAPPLVVIAFCVIVLMIAFILLLLRVISIFEAKRTELCAPLTREPFVSIMVASRNEPYQIVCRTIEALANMNYAQYEIIVIESNNQNQPNWQKIENFCETLGKVRFFHLDEIDGYKAGSLNYALKLVDQKSAILGYVDADYIVDPDFLKKTVGFFDDPKVGIVQLPQDYLDVNNYNLGLALDYRAFFSVLMNQAQENNAVTFTGTMGL